GLRLARGRCRCAGRGAKMTTGLTRDAFLSAWRVFEAGGGFAGPPWPRGLRRGGVGRLAPCGLPPSRGGGGEKTGGGPRTGGGGGCCGGRRGRRAGGRGAGARGPVLGLASSRVRGRPLLTQALCYGPVAARRADREHGGGVDHRSGHAAAASPR